MAFIETENGAELRLDVAIGGDVYHNIIHIRNQAGWTLASLEDCRDEIETYIVASDAAAFSSDASIIGFELTDISVYGGQSVTSTFSPLLVGSSVGSLASLNNSVGVKKDTGLTGRAYWGYLYHVGLPEAQVGNQTVTAGYVTTVQDWWNNFKNALSAAGYGMCVRQKTINTVPQNPYKLQFINQFIVVNARVTGLKKRVGR